MTAHKLLIHKDYVRPFQRIRAREAGETQGFMKVLV